MGRFLFGSSGPPIPVRLSFAHDADSGRHFFLAVLGAAVVLVIGVARAAEIPQTGPQGRLPSSVAPSVRLSAATETLAQVRQSMSERLDAVRTLLCNVEMSKTRSDKPTRKVYSGTLQIARDQGGRLVLTRKGSTDEYIASSRIIWSYDHKHKEARFIPASTPVVGTFVQEALRLNVFMSVDEGTLQLLGCEPVENEACWVLQGKSPARLKKVGVPISTILVWVSKSTGLPRKIRIPDEKDTTVVLRDFRTNEPVDPRQFQWSPPKGVKQKNIFGF